MANYPTLFAEIRQSQTNYLALPRESSERREFIPIAYACSDLITGDKLQTIPNASLYEFGVIISTMHMAWMRTTPGRLKSDCQYSAKITYNNFPWPAIASVARQSSEPSSRLLRHEVPRNDKLIAAIEAAAQAVLDARALHLLVCTPRSPCRLTCSRRIRRSIKPWLPPMAIKAPTPMTRVTRTCSSAIRSSPACCQQRKKPEKTHLM